MGSARPRRTQELAGPAVPGPESVSPVLQADYWDRGYPGPAYALLGGPTWPPWVHPGMPTAHGWHTGHECYLRRQQ